MNRTLALPALFALVGTASAASPVGAWTGRFLPKTPVLPANAPAARKAKLAADLATIKTGRMHLVLKADHTYTMHIVGLPMLGTPDTKGTWSQRGAFVDMVQSGAPKSARPLHLAYTDRRMDLSLGGGETRFVFVR